MNDAPMLYGDAASLLLRDSKRAGREISRRGAHKSVRLADIDNETDVTVEKLASNDGVTASGMVGVAKIGQLEAQLVTMAPAASGRLAMVADLHAMGTAELVHGHQRGLSRR